MKLIEMLLNDANAFFRIGVLFFDLVLEILDLVSLFGLLLEYLSEVDLLFRLVLRFEVRIQALFLDHRNEIIKI